MLQILKKYNSDISILINTQGGGYLPKILKHDINCNVIFEKTFSTINLRLNKHVYDNQGNCYILIEYGTAFITTQPGPFIVNGINLFKGLNLVKMDSTGALLWSKPVSDIYYSTTANIFYFNNEIIITGDFIENVVINGQNLFDLPSTNNLLKTFIAKYDTNGFFVNHIFVGNAQDHFTDSEIDINGNIYMATRNSSPPQSSSIIKIDNNMNFIWSKEISNRANNNSLYIPTNLYYNNTNNKLYLWGAFNNTVNVLGNIFSTNQSSLIFQSLLSEFNVSNGDLERISRFDNSSTGSLPGVSGSSHGNTAFFSHKNNDLYILSSFTSTMNFNNQSITSASFLNGGITYYGEDLVLFKVNLTNFNNEFILKSNNQTPFINFYSKDYAGPIIFNNDDLYITSTFISKPIEINGTLINNNSGNQNSDVLFINSILIK